MSLLDKWNSLGDPDGSLRVVNTHQDGSPSRIGRVKTKDAEESLRARAYVRSEKASPSGDGKPKDAEERMTDEAFFYEQILVHKVGAKRKTASVVTKSFCPTWPREWVAAYRECIIHVHKKIIECNSELKENATVALFREQAEKTLVKNRTFVFMEGCETRRQRTTLMTQLCGMITMHLKLSPMLSKNYGGNLAVPINTHYFREDYLGKAIQALTDLANAVGR